MTVQYCMPLVQFAPSLSGAGTQFVGVAWTYRCCQLLGGAAAKVYGTMKANTAALQRMVALLPVQAVIASQMLGGLGAGWYLVQGWYCWSGGGFAALTGGYRLLLV